MAGSRWCGARTGETAPASGVARIVIRFDVVSLFPEMFAAVANSGFYRVLPKHANTRSIGLDLLRPADNHRKTARAHGSSHNRAWVPYGSIRSGDLSRRYQSMKRIILPQAIRRMTPPFMNEFANLMKLTTLASVLAVYELMHESQNLISHTFRPLEVYTALAVGFFLLIFPIIYASQWLEKYWQVRG